MYQMSTVVEALDKHSRGSKSHKSDLHRIGPSELDVVFGSILNCGQVLAGF